jgi:hypothetical protein
MKTFAPFFSLTRRRKSAVAVWPCGSEWRIETPERGFDWECPIYVNGNQTSLTIMAPTKAALIAEIKAHGAQVVMA